MADETKKKLTQAQQLEAAKAQAEAAETALAAKAEEAEAAASEIESLKSDIASIKESVATLSETVNTLAESVKTLKSEEDEDSKEGDGEDEESKGDGDSEDEDKPESKEDYDEETKSILFLCKTAISGLSEDNATLKSLEQNIQKRASAKLTSMCAELGISPAIKTGIPADNSANAEKVDLSNLSGLDKVTAALKSKSNK